MKKVYMIYNINEENAEYCFAGYDYFVRQGILPKKSMYDMVYTGEIEDDGSDISELLERIFVMLNEGDRPADYHCHSLSVSDVVVYGGEAYFTDRFGFKKIPDFYTERSDRK